jgi:hypothetical protein
MRKHTVFICAFTLFLGLEPVLLRVPAPDRAPVLRGRSRPFPARNIAAAGNIEVIRILVENPFFFPSKEVFFIKLALPQLSSFLARLLYDETWIESSFSLEIS